MANITFHTITSNPSLLLQVNQTPELWAKLAIRKEIDIYMEYVKPTLDINVTLFEYNSTRKYVVQTPEICRLAVQKHGNLLQYVNEPTYDMYVLALNQNGYALQYIKDQTPELCLIAVKQSGFSLQFVQNQTEEICIEAVKQNSRALQFAKNRTI